MVLFRTSGTLLSMNELRNTHRDFALEEYNPKWAKTFELKEKQLRSVLGDQLVRAHHIGSTSIPGMLAKPQVDVLLEVKNLEEIPGYYEKMAAAGFRSMGRQYTRRPDNEYFVEDDVDGNRLVSIHTYQEGNPEIKNLLVFRDYLRENEEARTRYIETKRDLYEKFSDNYPSYRKGKASLIEELKAEALQWSKLKE